MEVIFTHWTSFTMSVWVFITALVNGSFAFQHLFPLGMFFDEVARSQQEILPRTSKKCPLQSITITSLCFCASISLFSLSVCKREKRLWMNMKLYNSLCVLTVHLHNGLKTSKLLIIFSFFCFSLLYAYSFLWALNVWIVWCQ